MTYSYDVEGRLAKVVASGYFSGGKVASYKRALNQPEQQTTTAQYDPAGTGLMTSFTDALGRQTAYTYHACGNTTSITHLAGTPNAVTTTMTYQTGSGTYPCVASFNQITSVADPLNQTTTFGYDSTGKKLTSITDPLQHTVTMVRNDDGQPASITDPPNNMTQFRLHQRRSHC